MKARLELAWEASLAEGASHNLTWPYLPAELQQSYLRVWYRPRLERALEQLSRDSDLLAQVLIELLELAELAPNFSPWSIS